MIYYYQAKIGFNIYCCGHIEHKARTWLDLGLYCNKVFACDGVG